MQNILNCILEFTNNNVNCTEHFIFQNFFVNLGNGFNFLEFLVYVAARHIFNVLIAINKIVNKSVYPDQCLKAFFCKFTLILYLTL